MMNWWNDLSRREQQMLMVLAALVGLFLVGQFGAKPVLDWRANSEQRVERARDGYSMVVAAAAKGNSAKAIPAQNQTPLRQALTQSAAAARIDLVRIGAAVNGQIEVQPEDLDGARLFQWIAALKSQYGVTVAFADIARTNEGVVKAQVLVFEQVK